MNRNNLSESTYRLLSPVSPPNQGDFQYPHLEINVVRLAVLADEGVKLSVSREIEEQIPHQLGFSGADG